MVQYQEEAEAERVGILLCSGFGDRHIWSSILDAAHGSPARGLTSSAGSKRVGTAGGNPLAPAA